MKIVIFAGGIGTRLWPLSRKNSPKQFDKIFNGKSTLQLAVERTASFFGEDNIYIQTVPEFEKMVREQVGGKVQIFIEPSRRNVGPAVCLALHKLKMAGLSGPVAIIWADHLMERPREFGAALATAEKLILESPHRFVFFAERPRFANNNLGWIEVGKRVSQMDGSDYYEFLGWRYRPNQDECDAMFKSGEYHWNPGYFVSSIDFILSEYKKIAGDIFRIAEETVMENDLAAAERIYGAVAKVTFDKCLIEKTDLQDAIVIKTNMGWSDPGTLYALKEALQKNQEENVAWGEVDALYSRDCLVYNLEKDKMVAAVGLDGVVVVNTKDALIVVPKGKAREVTELVEKLEREGKEKYL